MRRITLVSIGIFAIWLGGCVGEAQPVETPDTASTAGDETTSAAEVSNDESSGTRRTATGSSIGTSDQSLRLDTRPPPLPLAPEAPPAPSDGK